MGQRPTPNAAAPFWAKGAICRAANHGGVGGRWQKSRESGHSISQLREKHAGLRQFTQSAIHGAHRAEHVCTYFIRYKRAQPRTGRPTRSASSSLFGEYAIPICHRVRNPRGRCVRTILHEVIGRPDPHTDRPADSVRSPYLLRLDSCAEHRPTDARRV